jgi:hypothetical protein
VYAIPLFRLQVYSIDVCFKMVDTYFTFIDIKLPINFIFASGHQGVSKSCVYKYVLCTPNVQYRETIFIDNFVLFFRNIYIHFRCRLQLHLKIKRLEYEEAEPYISYISQQRSVF